MLLCRMQQPFKILYYTKKRSALFMPFKDMLHTLMIGTERNKIKVKKHILFHVLVLHPGNQPSMSFNGFQWDTNL